MPAATVRRLAPAAWLVVLAALYLNGVSGSEGFSASEGDDPVGACCYPDGTCVFESVVDCLLAGGEFTDVDVTCVRAACPVLGACCLPNGHCHLHDEFECVRLLDGVYQGPLTPCAKGVCIAGACCLSDGTCVPVAQGPCLVLGGAWNGPESLCVETACPATPPCPGDVTGDGMVGNLDLLTVLSWWGACPSP